MSYISTKPIVNSTILRLYSEKDEINHAPDYQRQGGVWTLEKKQLLMDSIFNDYDIPKIYFHEFRREDRQKDGYRYAVIDGRQRLEAIWEFMEGAYKLSEDATYQDDSEVRLSGLGYEDIAKNYPKLKIKFDSFVLPVIGIETDDIELIEDMFSRLNEAAPLNSAEKRNAIGGAMVGAIREISAHRFFSECVSFGNRRFQHREVVARILLVETHLRESSRITDTKREYLDALAKNYRTGKDAEVRAVSVAVVGVLDRMADLFVKTDELLRAQGILVVYYLLFKSAEAENQLDRITRQSLLAFRQHVADNRKKAEQNYAEAKFELLEFDRFSQQGTNDASNIRERLRVIAEFFGIKPIV